MQSIYIYSFPNNKPVFSETSFVKANDELEPD